MTGWNENAYIEGMRDGYAEAQVSLLAIIESVIKICERQDRDRDTSLRLIRDAMQATRGWGPSTRSQQHQEGSQKR